MHLLGILHFVSSFYIPLIQVVAGIMLVHGAIANSNLFYGKPGSGRENRLVTLLGRRRARIVGGSLGAAIVGVAVASIVFG